MPAQPLLAVTDDQTCLPAERCPGRRLRAPQIRNVHCNDPTPAAALPFGTTKGGLGRLERTIAIVASAYPIASASGR
jgi:hypothetical protein